VSNTFGLRRIVPLLPASCRAHPALELDLVLTDAIVDLVAERIDVAVRSGVLCTIRPSWRSRCCKRATAP
jgi:DNA-binding transcriptional LysR family regulator